MATTNKLFTLSSGNTGDLAVSTTSATISIASLLSRSEDSIRLASDVNVRVRLTNGAGTAVAPDLLMFAGSVEVFSVPPDATNLSAVAIVGSGLLNWAISKGA